MNTVTAALLWALCSNGPVPPGKSPCLFETYPDQATCISVETAFFKQMTNGKSGIPAGLSCQVAHK
jgi:hypothetical protein